MEKECDKYPRCTHRGCELDHYEKIVAEYLELRGFGVERLCKEWLPSKESPPDFRITRDNNLCCLCEVKGLKSSPTGASTKSDWEYENRRERRKFEKLKEKLTESQNRTLVVDNHNQMRRWRGEIPYPTGGRSTTKNEKEYEKKLKDYLSKSHVADRGLEVIIHRGDWLLWTKEELEDFVNWFVEKLELIDKGQIPRGWYEESGIIDGIYRKKREDIWHIKNEIIVKRTDPPPLSVKVTSYLEPNWAAIEERCKKAQKQIKDRLNREDTPDIARLVIVFPEISLRYFYFDRTEELLDEIHRHVFRKAPELSAIAFCEVPKAGLDSKEKAKYLQAASHFFPDSSGEDRIRFLVFHTPNTNVPELPNQIFDDGFSAQVRLPT